MTHILPSHDPSRTIVLATRNPGKMKEFAELLRPFDLKVKGLHDFPELEDVAETGSSFTANALLKTAYASEHTGLVAIADDSGLCVDALNGAPGVYSARYSLMHSHDAAETEVVGHHLHTQDVDRANNQKLLRNLLGVPLERRTAAFHSVIAASSPTGCSITAHGEWTGVIGESEQGTYGFGYDPLFIDTELGLSAAAMDPTVKNARSHRAKAIRSLAELWPHFWAKHLHDLEEGRG